MDAKNMKEMFYDMSFLTNLQILFYFKQFSINLHSNVGLVVQVLLDVQ